MKLRVYNSCTTFTTSDHQPVYAVFDSQIRENSLASSVDAAPTAGEEAIAGEVNSGLDPGKEGFETVAVEYGVVKSEVCIIQ